MQIEASAIVVAMRRHGEHGAVVRVLTPDHGLLAGYVRGGNSRQLRPVLISGNLVRIDWRVRVESQLAAMTVELVEARSALMREPLAAGAVEWVTALAATVLPEGQRYPAVHSALDGVLLAIVSAPSARGWAAALASYEAVVLAELGYGTTAARHETTTLDQLAATGRRLAADLLTDRRAAPLAARERLVERLARALS